MTDFASLPATAFDGVTRLAHGPLSEVALAVRHAGPRSILTFDDATGRVIDLDLRGTDAEIVARLAARGGPPAGAEPRGRGRPKLGVTAREITLLPRHWDCLAKQPGGASATLRRLVDEARRGDGGRTRAKAAIERTYRFVSALAGDLPGFEEASRALFSGDANAFEARMADWPADVRAYALKLMQPDEAEA